MPPNGLLKAARRAATTSTVDLAQIAAYSARHRAEHRRRNRDGAWIYTGGYPGTVVIVVRRSAWG